MSDNEGDTKRLIKLNGYSAHAVAVAFSLVFGGGGLASYKNLSDKLDDVRTCVVELKTQGTAAAAAAARADTLVMKLEDRVNKLEQHMAATAELLREMEKKVK